jgi:NitT/TauT family transport system substrate-binding protein
MKRYWLILLIPIILLSACSPAATAAPLQKISLPVGYIPNVQFAPIYVAIEKGWFKDAGFDLSLDYSFETDAMALVGAGQLPFAVVSGEQVLLARAQGLPVVYTFAWYQQFPVGIVSLKEANITRPADLKGKRVGIPVLSGASYVGLQALLNAGGLKESDVQLDTIGFNQLEMLTTGKEDAVVVYITNEPIQLESKGYSSNLMKVSDYQSLVSNGLITNETMLKQHPEQVQALNQALRLGIEYTISNPDDAYEISKKYVENLANADEKVQKQVLATSIEMWKSENIGFSQPSAWENMQSVLLGMGSIPSAQELDKAYTNQWIK